MNHLVHMYMYMHYSCLIAIFSFQQGIYTEEIHTCTNISCMYTVHNVEDKWMIMLINGASILAQTSGMIISLSMIIS